MHDLEVKLKVKTSKPQENVNIHNISKRVKVMYIFPM